MQLRLALYHVSSNDAPYQLSGLGICDTETQLSFESVAAFDRCRCSQYSLNAVRIHIHNNPQCNWVSLSAKTRLKRNCALTTLPNDLGLLYISPTDVLCSSKSPLMSCLLACIERICCQNEPWDLMSPFEFRDAFSWMCRVEFIEAFISVRRSRKAFEPGRSP
ncbi:hypothetical protein PHLGIDRAFT_327218 [Phlebiopsis gigantea 11061_1 CR5-6]|uniref:Uncharacterized protein n=1 Tax=Phlebiopsis gigantea (strain 11061_1 CR5-6) TaxID=745531 RepID=A0A0C3SFK0_PHLG1|nr:hypothetical protein PHLGIDRAFT_327218 [Phlebiopsis gigantea 11061_1 CR5-6]